MDNDDCSTLPSPAEPQNRSCILLIDDDPVVTLIVRLLLERQYKVLTAPNGLQGFQAFREGRPDLVLLDATMPGLDGWEVLRRIRELRATPVIMLTAHVTPDDVVRGLRGGADDYVTKPFTAEVLEARIQAIFRRIALEREQRFEAGQIHLDGGRLVVDLVRAQVLKDGQTIDLSTTEYRLLTFLAVRPDVPVLATDILAYVWGAAYTEEIGYVKSYVRLLRRKIEDDPSSPRYLIVRRGRGYTLVSSPRRST